MGWDAFAVRVRGKKELGRSYARSYLTDPKLRPLFIAAEAEVKRLASTCDGFLRYAALDCSACAYEFERCTGQTAWAKNGYTPEQVKQMADESLWTTESCDPDNLWAFYSVKMFIQTCAKAGLGVRFSW